MNPNTLIPVGGRKKFCPSEVILLQGDINYTKLFLTDGSTIIVGTTLGKLEPRFASFNFFRTHKSFMVNLGFVDLSQPYSQFSFRLTNDMEITVSRRKRTSFIQKISNSIN